MTDINIKTAVLFLGDYSAKPVTATACLTHLETLFNNTWTTRGAMVFTCCAQAFRKCNRIIRGVHSVSVGNYFVCDLWVMPKTSTVQFALRFTTVAKIFLIRHFHAYYKFWSE